MSVNFYTPTFYVFNNFSAHAIEFRGRWYPTAEHAYQAMKCTDPHGQEEIRNARSPLLAKRLANGKYRGARDPSWDSKKLAVVEEILRTKLAQHAEAREALIDSGGKEIVEDSPDDYFWGSGADGSGQNFMGRIWMKIREGATDL